MQSVTAALTWEYLARNRGTLLMFPLLATFPALFMIHPLSGLEASPEYQDLSVRIYIANVLCLSTIIGAGVISTQGSPSRLYLMPISTTAIVNIFYWGGAILVACQVALMLWMWKMFFASDWPIVSSVLFAVVFWGAFQPIFRGSLTSFWGIALALAIFVALSVWLTANHGIPLQRGGAISAQVHHWTTVSGTDILISITALFTSYVLTLRRVNYNRGGRRRQTLTDRGLEFLQQMDVRWVWSTRPFKSREHACVWFDFLRRTVTIPMTVSGFLLWFLILPVIIGTIAKDPGLGLSMALVGTGLAAVVQVIAGLVVALVQNRGITVTQEVPMFKQTITINPLPLGMSPYLFSLPMSDRQRAHAILRSSAGACGSASAVILLSLTVVFGLSWVLGADLFKGNEKGPTKLDTIVPWSIVAVWGGSLLLSFVFATIVFTLDFRKWKLRDWITPVILVATLLACFTPIALSLSMGLCAIAAGFAVYATVQAVLREDISWVGASLVWLAGFAFFAVLLAGLPKELGDYGLALGSILVLLAMLPFFTTAAAIRNLRTT